MDQQGKTEIETIFGSAGLLDAEVTNDPGREDMSFVHVHTVDIDPARVMHAMNVYNLSETSDRTTGPRLQFVHYSHAREAEVSYYSILFKDLNARTN